MPSFETAARRVLSTFRREGAQGQDQPLVPIGYHDSSEDLERALAGDADAIYTHAIARASSSGDSEVDVEAGEAQRLLSDLAGRLWSRLFVDGAPVSAANPLPVTGSGGGTLAIQGNVANDAVDAGNPVKIGGRARNMAGITAVAIDDRVDAAYDVNGRAQVVISGANRWSKFNTVLATPATTFVVFGAAGVLGRLEITADAGSVDMYALVYDGADATGTLVGRFLVPGEGTAIVDYSNQGGLDLTTGCFVALTSDPGAVTAPAVGGFAHAQYALV